MNGASKLKILLCESNPRVLSRLESWIEAMGENVNATMDGITALELFKEELPDILLISQDLKNMGGVELIEEVKKIIPNQAVVMMLSEEDTVFKRAIDLQVDKYLNKPVEATQLFHIIEDLAQEKLWHKEFKAQKRVLQDYKEAIDLSFSVSRHDKEGNVTYVNDLFCISTGLSYSNAMQGVINPLKNDNEDMKAVWDQLNNNRIYRDRQVFKIKDEKERIIDVTAVALMNENDTIYEYLVFTDDVTKIIEAARRVKNQELEKRLTKINHTKELNRVKDSFLTIFTHELKTPLNSIINFSEYVGKHLDKESFEKKEKLLFQVKEINNSGHFMLHMISNLMEAMKLKDTKIDLALVKIDLNNSIRSLIESKFHNKVIHNSSTQELIIVSDELRVVQIIENLLSNALSYSKSRVEISTRSDKDTFSIEISDDGEGFKNIDNIFNLFEQADSDSLTRESQGVGTGLFIVKQLCDRMTYSIELLSSEKLGGAKVIVKGRKDIQ